MWQVDPTQVIFAIVLDLLVGDPRGWPHIARGAGALSLLYEKILTQWCQRSVGLGLLFWVLVSGTMFGCYGVVYVCCAKIHPWVGWLWQSLIIYQAVAATDLARHTRAVIAPLLLGDLPAARRKLSFMVGRDTSELNSSEISRGAIEAVAESTTDAIIAPLFWGILAGAPGALFYRTANTLDSMVGHHTPAYEKFGKVSARADDLLNWLPARLTLVGFGLWAPSVFSPVVRLEASAHVSPNAGWSESAMAHALGVKLGGDNYYDGEKVAGPIFNPKGRLAQPTDVSASLIWMWKVCALCAFGFLTLSFILHDSFHL